MSDFCGIGFDVLSVILRATFWVNWVQYSPYFNNTCTLARFEAVQRRVCQIITGGGIHRPTAVTVVLLSWTAFLLVVNSKPKNCSIRSSTSQNIAYCYLNTDLLPNAREHLSLIVSDLPTNCRALFAKTNRFENLLFVIL